MSENLSLHFKHEVATWIRALDFLQAENIVLKNRLAELLKLQIPHHLLEKVENYQNTFLSKDAIFSILRHDIKEHKKSLQHLHINNNIDDSFFQKQQVLRNDMEKMEKEFSRLKAEFNNYLAEVL